MKEYLTIAAFVFIFLVIVLCACHLDNQKRLKYYQKTYPVWVKYTGNKSNLTFEEWVKLKEARLLGSKDNKHE